MAKHVRNFRNASLVLGIHLRDRADVERYVYSLQAIGGLSIAEHLLLLQDIALKQGRGMEPTAKKHLDAEIEALWQHLPGG